MRTLCTVMAMLSFAFLTGCNTAPKTETGRENLHDEVQTALNRFEREDPDLKHFLDNSVGYAMFPSAGKAGLGIGGAYGKGEVFQGDRMIGFADIRQGSVGLQAGAQEFAELVVFGERSAMEKFMDEKLSFDANASAILLKAGAAKSASFRDGVAIFAEAKGGAMVELSVSGQQFTYQPMNEHHEETTEMHTEMKTDMH